MDNTKPTKFTTMLYNNRHLILKRIEDKSPSVIAECYLPEAATQICELLTEAANAALEETKKEA